MSNAIRTHLIQIGNSQGIRIPKALIEQAHLSGDVEIVVQESQLVVRAAPRPRAGWAAAFQRMAAAGDDALLDAESLVASDWDETEWQW
ncbi:MAG TPA: AbrB/MazE/SpoVT family DNA-binding domain-containing protein [Chloroflexota bacterium]|nr:AbrB/MazE/SpoVT family DNA-binding domain-containing protein [Chloroflexota bacterium]